MICGIGYVVINVGISNFLEPRFLGRGLKLSPLIVLISIIFWGWVLGPMGMLLSLPLTAVVKLALEANPDTRWLAVLLGSGTEAQPVTPRADGDPGEPPSGATPGARAGD